MRFTRLTRTQISRVEVFILLAVETFFVNISKQCQSDITIIGKAIIKNLNHVTWPSEPEY